MSFILSCCSTADMPAEYYEKRDINYVCFHFELDGKDYIDDLGKTMSMKEFYDAMRNGAMTKTSQVNAEEYEAYFESFLKEGHDMLHLCLSSGISGTANSAMIAQRELQEKYPERKIYVVDSYAASAGFGLLMDKLADMRDEGKTIDEVYAWAMDNRLKLHHWFFTSDLTFFVRGGRVSKVSGFVGNVLNICPLLNVDFEGKLIPRYKIRTKRKAIQAIVDKMEETAIDGLDYSGKCFISNSDCMEDAQAVADLIEERFPKLNGKVYITSIGTTIGSHTGPGTVALFYWGQTRVD